MNGPLQETSTGGLAGDRFRRAGVRHLDGRTDRVRLAVFAVRRFRVRLLAARQQTARIELQPHLHIAANFQRIDAGDLQPRIARLEVLIRQKANFQLRAAAHVLAHAKPHRGRRVHQLGVHLQVGRFDEQVVLRPWLVHVAVNADRARKLAADDLPDLAPPPAEIVEFQVRPCGASRMIASLRRRDALARRRGKHQEAQSARYRRASWPIRPRSAPLPGRRLNSSNTSIACSVAFAITFGGRVCDQWSLGK